MDVWGAPGKYSFPVHKGPAEVLKTEANNLQPQELSTQQLEPS